jgi:hypothetical protein
VFVTTVSGSVSGVLGLPLHETAFLLGEWGRSVSDVATNAPGSSIDTDLPRWMRVD